MYVVFLKANKDIKNLMEISYHNLLQQNKKNEKSHIKVHLPRQFKQFIKKTNEMRKKRNIFYCQVSL